MPQGKCVSDEFGGFLKQLQHTGFKIRDHLHPDLLDGDPWLFISIYQHLFYEYQECITSVVARSFPPWTLTDSLMKRIRLAFAIMINVFGYTPALKSHQFIARKFSRQKVIMCSDILKLIDSQMISMKYKYNSLPRNPLLPQLQFKHKSMPKYTTRLITSKIDLTSDFTRNEVLNPKILVKVQSIDGSSRS